MASLARGWAAMSDGADGPAADLVREVYRGLFAREADAEGLRYHASRLAAGASLSDVLRTFAASPEFTRRYGGAPAFALPVVDYDPPLLVETKLTEPDLRALWAHVGATWATLGETDPYWSVLSDPRFRLPHMSDQAVLRAFYASGENDLKRLQAWLARNRRTLTDAMAVAEYGCGVGRLTSWLAPCCRHLTAFDISPTHLDRAQRWLDNAGCHNVDYRLVRTPDDLAALSGMDLFVSLIVLQHNPPPLIAHVLECAFAGLNRGGLAYFQVPTYRTGYAFRMADYTGVMRGEGGIEMHLLPQPEIFALAARHGVTPLEVAPDGLVGDWGVSNTFLMQKS